MFHACVQRFDGMDEKILGRKSLIQGNRRSAIGVQESRNNPCYGRADRPVSVVVHPLVSVIIVLVLSSAVHVLLAKVCHSSTGRPDRYTVTLVITARGLRPCLVCYQNFFHSSRRIFRHMHGTLNVHKKIN